MKQHIGQNIARYRKEEGLTQEELGGKLGITSQAVSKWETEQAMPDIALLPALADILHISIDQMLGYGGPVRKDSYYVDIYKTDEYYWGIAPSDMCLRVLALMPPNRPLKLLDIGCGEGKDAVFFARCGYEVSAFDVAQSGVDKLRRLADVARVHVNAVKANIWDFRIDTQYDILYSSGALHYIKPDLRDEIMQNYKQFTNIGGLHAFHVFVDKPFIAPPPENEPYSFFWKSGDLFSYYHDWRIEEGYEYIFPCNSSGVPHEHACNKVFARRVL